MRLLLLAGTGGARQIAARLSEMAGVDTIASLAGATRSPEPLDVEARVGGFGGEAAFRGFLRDQGIDAVLDATHPFAHRISLRTAQVCRDLGLPYCQYLRPQWAPEPGDDWVDLPSEAEAADHVSPDDVVFLATGRQTLPRFSQLCAAKIYCRQIDPPDREFPFENGAFLVGRPPFSVAQEEALFAELGVDWLFVKNAGGEAPKTKLVAARNLGIRVGMIARPPQPDGLKVDNVGDALRWVEGLAT